MSRRVVFFVGAAVTCAALVLVAPADLRWVPAVVATVYGLLAALTALEEWSAGRQDREP
jgi:hypothetical protein